MADADHPDDADPPGDKGPKGEVVRFPQSRVAPPGGKKRYKEIGTSRFAERYGNPDRQATDHWCSYCRGIWFGYLLEVTCPACGNRRG